MSFFMSKEWCDPEWLTDPAPRKRSALKNACVKRWKIAAVHAPTPRAMTMYPSWLIVEYARTFLMSSCTNASDAPTSTVIPPIADIQLIQLCPGPPIDNPWKNTG